MNIDSFIFHGKTENINKEVAEDIGTRFDTSSFELDTSLPKRKYKK